MLFFVLFLFSCSLGLVLFRRLRLDNDRVPFYCDCKASVIIPARNEEQNLPNLLNSLMNQTCRPYEIIVVDDFSSDATAEIARSFGVEVIPNSKLPEGWTGKTWAVHNGFLQSSGDLLVFLDSDVRLAPGALEALLHTRQRCGGAISVVPYHYTEKFYERFSLLPYVLGVFAFTSPFEQKNKKKGLYGSCIVTSREDYLKINGHESVRGELLDDLNLGRKFTEAGIPVTNFIGCDFVSFRMYPGGIASEMQGFGKGAVLSTATLQPATTILIAVWLVGLLAVQFVTPFLLVFMGEWTPFFVMGYAAYTLQILYFLKYTGRYGRIIPLLHFFSSVFFIAVMLYSVYQVTFLGSVLWKGRQIKVGGEKRC